MVMEKAVKGQIRGEETRSRILQVAEQAFARGGYDTVGVAEICQLAGVSKGAFYHHFNSKESLFLELLDRWLSDLDQQLMRSGWAEISVQQGVDRLTALSGMVFQEAGDRYRIVLEFFNQAIRDPKIWQATIAHLRRYQDFFSQLIRSGMEQGLLKPVDPDHIGRMALSLGIGILLQSLLDPTYNEWGNVLLDSIRLILEGIAA
jgi:AcrR family transcriptional regulator